MWDFPMLVLATVVGFFANESFGMGLVRCG